MRIDVVMLSCAKTPALRAMTQNAIDSLLASETEHEFRIGVLDPVAEYQQVLNIPSPEGPFNYNRSMNHGRKALAKFFPSTQADFIVLANNDLHFHEGWFSAIANLEDRSCSSFSPWNPICGDWPHEGPLLKGYGVGGCVCGWCLVIRPEVFAVIGDLDETCSFWCSDNLYAGQIAAAGIQHALVRDSHVRHFGGVTLFTESPEAIHRLTAEQAQIFARRGQ